MIAADLTPELLQNLLSLLDDTRYYSNLLPGLSTTSAEVNGKIAQLDLEAAQQVDPFASNRYQVRRQQLCRELIWLQGVGL